MKVLISLYFLGCLLILNAYSMEGSGKGVESDKSCPQMELLRGRDGRDGRDGASGTPGEKGERGDAGPAGQTGPQGSVGEKGDSGPPGESGAVGLTGPRGPVGNKGEPGNQGQRGAQGVQGEQGPHGPVGPKGDRGSQGVMGSPGQQGSPGRCDDCNNCTQTYVRWGRTTCPSNISTKLVYSGRAGSSHYNNGGGATNYLCMPDDPEYLLYNSDVQGPNYVYGVQYYAANGQPFRTQPNVDAHNVPCAVCMAVSRCSLIMIPAKTQCPSSWTTEYVGYLMSGAPSHTLPTTYECVDKDPESVPGLDGDGNGPGLFYHVEISCDGMKCPPYVAGRELTCVVCTR